MSIKIILPFDSGAYGTSRHFTETGVETLAREAFSSFFISVWQRGVLHTDARNIRYSPSRRGTNVLSIGYHVCRAGGAVNTIFNMGRIWRVLSGGASEWLWMYLQVVYVAIYRFYCLRKKTTEWILWNRWIVSPASFNNVLFFLQVSWSVFSRHLM